LPAGSILPAGLLLLAGARAALLVLAPLRARLIVLLLLGLIGVLAGILVHRLNVLWLWLLEAWLRSFP
jgi:hypothetical protein